MTARQWAKRYGVRVDQVRKLGGEKRLEAMKPLGRELLMCVVKARTSPASVKRRALEIAREETKRMRGPRDLALREARLQRRICGAASDLVWLGSAVQAARRVEVKQPPAMEELPWRVEKLMELATRRRAS